MNRQQAFNKAYRGLANQGFVRSTKSDGVQCMYRGIRGRKCAIGQLIPNGQYRPEFENFTGRELDSLEAPELFHRLADDLGIDFLAALQIAHDGSGPEYQDRTPDEMRDRLETFACAYDLEIPSL